MRIGIDIMGGDFAPEKIIQGAILALDEISASSQIVLFGEISKIKFYLRKYKVDYNKFTIINCNDVIEMGEHPTKAFKQKPDSSISKAFKVKYEYHKEAFKILENYYGKSKFNEGRKKMAKMPRGSKLIYNPSSAAPGFITKNILSLPGVPSILNSMIENCKRYLIKGSKVHSKTLNLFTVESNISKRLGLIQKKYKKFVDIGSYPFFRLGKIGVSIVTRSTSKIKLQSVNKDLIKLVRLKKIEILKI